MLCSLILFGLGFTESDTEKTAMAERRGGHIILSTDGLPYGHVEDAVLIPREKARPLGLQLDFPL